MRCKKCEMDKDEHCFGKCSRSKNGFKSKCKECYKELGRIYRLNNKEAVNNSRKLYYKNNKEKWKEYEENKKEILKEKKRVYYLNNKEKRKEYNRLNREKRNIKRSLITDKLYRIKNSIRSSIGRSIRNKGYVKSIRTQEILGCSFNEFYSYLESNFEDWMNWDNYGLYNGEFNYGWDIDHIIPLNEVIIEVDILKLNHYTNLQPLCSKINRDIKKDKICAIIKD
jgi:hypothetical protein